MPCQPCGCDPEANYMCERHEAIKIVKEHEQELYENSRDKTLDELVIRDVAPLIQKVDENVVKIKEDLNRHGPNFECKPIRTNPYVGPKLGPPGKLTQIYEKAGIEVIDTLFPKVQQGAHFTSGAHSNEEKPRYDLVPACALRREAIRMAEGARDHGDKNYQKGIGDTRFMQDRVNHLVEHIIQYADGDRSDDHLAAIRCNAGILIWLEEATKKPT